MALKLQPAMEYLLTYGWAVLIIVIVLIALSQLGLLRGSMSGPKAAPGACEVYRSAVSYPQLEGECIGGLPQFTAQLDGQSGYVSTSYQQNLISSYTITAWIKTNSSAGNPVFQDRGSGAGMSVTMEIGYNGGQSGHPGTVNCGVDSNGIWIGGYTSATVNDGNWHFVVCTLSATPGSAIVTSSLNAYVDGSPAPMSATQIGSATAPINGLGPSVIGYHAAWNNYFSGQISNVQVYNTSLTSNQIQLLYQEGIGGAPVALQNLVGWWPLNGNAQDYSGNDNNGASTGGLSYISSWTKGYTLP